MIDATSQGTVAVAESGIEGLLLNRMQRYFEFQLKQD